MSGNLSVLTLPLDAPNSLDFEICDRRYGTNLDIPRCDVAVSRLGFGPSSTTYHVGRQQGPHTLPQTLNYGGCVIAVEIAGPHLPVTYNAVPDAIQSLASHVVNECVGRARRVGGFATMDIARLIDFVVDSAVDLDEYPPSSTFLTVSVTSKAFNILSPGNYDPVIADTLAGAARDAVAGLPASGGARRTLVQRAVSFRSRAMRMSVRGHQYTWWGIPTRSSRRRGR
ncbi:MAG: hypothetical protein Q9177_004396 [Variospora cf. flavescens]